MYIEEEITLFELAERFGIEDLRTPCVYDVSNFEFEILSHNHQTHKDEYKQINEFLVKERVQQHYQLDNLKGTSNHKVYFKNEYVELYKHPNSKLVNEQMDVVDLSVNETHNYYANNQLNHNTTPAGQAVPFHASIRIRLTGEGTAVKDKEGNVIGIRVPLKIIKNKVAPPFRNFPIEIHFGKGISESESLLEAGMEYCNKNKHVVRGNKLMSITGSGGWKTFLVTTTDGEVLFEKKFTKNDFATLMSESPTKEMLLEFYDTVLTVVFGEATNEPNLNPTSDVGEEV